MTWTGKSTVSTAATMSLSKTGSAHAISSGTNATYILRLQSVHLKSLTCVRMLRPAQMVRITVVPFPWKLVLEMAQPGTPEDGHAHKLQV